MNKQPRHPLLNRLCAGFLISIIWVLVHTSQAYAEGQGANGVWPVTERYVLMADTSLPGLVLVDIQTGIATERLRMDKLRPVGVASCPDCNFVLITGGDSGLFWLLQLESTTSALIEKTGKLNLDKARLEPLEISTVEGKLLAGKQAAVSADGKTAFIASRKDHALFKVDFSKKPNAKKLLKGKRVDAYGVNWDTGGGLLVSMNKREVWRTTVDGEVLAIYDTKAAGCPGTGEFNPTLRAAIDDPLNKGSVLILANTKSHGSAIWRLRVDSQGRQSCTNVAGKIGPDPGWVDAVGVAIEFSRPHHFAIRPNTQPPQLIITDMDNRALRLLDLTTYASSTVMYNRDHTLSVLTPEERVSRVSCAQLKWPTVTAATGTTETPSCIQPPQSDVLKLTLTQAKAHCSSQGARLCEPAELLVTDPVPAALVWSAAECASCWQGKVGEHCGAKIAELKAPGKAPEQVNLSRTWNSGQALVMGAVAGNSAVTVCRPVEDTLKAAAACCADQITSP